MKFWNVKTQNPDYEIGEQNEQRQPDARIKPLEGSVADLCKIKTPGFIHTDRNTDDKNCDKAGSDKQILPDKLGVSIHNANE